MRHSAQMLQSKPSTGSLETFGTGDVVYLQIIHISSLEFHPSFCPSFWPLLRLADRLLLSSSANPSVHFCIPSSLNLSESCQYSTCRHWCHEKLTAFLLNGGQGFLMPPPWEIIRPSLKDDVRWLEGRCLSPLTLLSPFLPSHATFNTLPYTSDHLLMISRRWNQH